MTQVKSPKAFNGRIYSLIKDAMDLKGDLTVAPEDDSIEVNCNICANSQSVHSTQHQIISAPAIPCLSTSSQAKTHLPLSRSCMHEQHTA